MRAYPILLLLSVIISGCGNTASNSNSSAPVQQGRASTPAPAASAPAAKQPQTKDNSYTPPTAEEMAPLRPEYAAELAKIHEPPEMSRKPMQVRKIASPNVAMLANVMSTIGTPEKASHEQRQAAIKQLLDIAGGSEQGHGLSKPMVYGAIAVMSCLDGDDPHTTIGYATNALGDGDDGLVLRARMYLKAGNKAKALDDLEKVMSDGDGHPLAGGGADPRKATAPCGWSLADLDALGDDPRALAAKALYQSAFIGFGAASRGTIKEADIRALYTRAAASWRSPIPHYLQITTYGFGSEHSMTGASCQRANTIGAAAVPEIVAACSAYDDITRQEIRELTMALVIQPTFARALSERAEKYLQLAQGAYADGKPSRRLFELAIKDYNAAIAADAKNLHTLYCDRALAYASIGKYQEAVTGYREGMKYAKSGTEEDPFLYEQLAGLYMKLGKFNDAAEQISQAIMNASGGGMDVVIFGGGIKSFRTLYPEYDLLPDEILADVVRRRYYPQFAKSWDADFVEKAGAFKGKVSSSVLADLYALRGDAYMKAGRRSEALADFGRLKSDAWDGQNQYLPKNMYFDASGHRNPDLPEPWPPAPSTM
jgi:tetratricopeptide (TPR) repeat protein